MNDDRNKVLLIGVLGAVALFWLLNKACELLPRKWENRLKPYALILPAFAVIGIFLLYPAVETVMSSNKAICDAAAASRAAQNPRCPAAVRVVVPLTSQAPGSASVASHDFACTVAPVIATFTL